MPILYLVYFLIVFFNSSKVFAYPEFIGYKYSSCLTCHFNGQGNGPLNDYGRALWASEIAGRAGSQNKTEEQLADESGFLGANSKLPVWLRPGFKMRGLYVLTNPGGAATSNRTILMQADANLAMLFGNEQRFAFISSFGYAPTPQRLKNNKDEAKKNFISREHYFRIQATDNLWLYLGLLDKTFGIRSNNHTAYSRAKTGIAQNDQAHSLIMHYIQPKWELSIDAFGGNMMQDKALRQTGFSTLYEYESQEAFRTGFSYLSSKNDYVKQERIAVHARLGLGYGSAVLAELGLINNTPLSDPKTKGYYLYTEAIQKISRGYHWFVQGQSYKEDLNADFVDNVKLGTGLLMFPGGKYEVRVEAENTHQISTSADVAPDVWSIMTQLHLSL